MQRAGGVFKGGQAIDGHVVDQQRRQDLVVCGAERPGGAERDVGVRGEHGVRAGGGREAGMERVLVQQRIMGEADGCDG